MGVGVIVGVIKQCPLVVHDPPDSQMRSKPLTSIPFWTNTGLLYDPIWLTHIATVYVLSPLSKLSKFEINSSLRLPSTLDLYLTYRLLGTVEYNKV